MPAEGLTMEQVHVDMLLSNMSFAIMNDMKNFIASRAFPTIQVTKQSDRYVKFDKTAFLRARGKVRGLNEESAGGGYKVDNTPTYLAKKWSWHHDLSDDIIAAADDPFQPRLEAITYVSHSLMLTMEQEWVTKFFTTGVWANEWAGVTSNPNSTQFIKWSIAGSTPIKDIKGRARAIQGATGWKPNVLVVNPIVFEALQDHADIIDRVKYTSRETVNAEVLAKLLDLEEVLIAEAVLDTADEGSTPTPGFAVPNHALLLYRPQTPGKMTPAAGYNFAWKLPSTNGDLTVAVKEIPMPWKETTRVEGTIAFAFEQVSADLAHFFLNAV